MTLIKIFALVTSTSWLFLAAVAFAQETIDNNDMAPPGEQIVPVADEVSDEAPEVADATTVPELTDEELLMAEFARYKELMNNSVYDEADSVAKRVIELAIRVTGARSNDTAKALTNLAIVQHRNQNYDLAQQNFEAAVDILEENEDRLNEQLINPLKGLGAAQLEGGRPDLATGTFQRAVHVTHVNEGPHNLDQVSILESLAEANLRMGSMDTAKQIQDTIYAINLRYHAGSAMDLVPSLVRRAEWQHRAGFIYDERTTYRRIIRIIEDGLGKDSLELVEPLTRLGQSFFYVDTSGAQTYQATAITTGEIYFKRAVRIAEDHPDSDWQTVAATTLALGDFYMYQGTQQRARKVYAEVWELLSGDNERLDFRREELQELVTLRERPIPQYLRNAAESGEPIADDTIRQGRVAVTYVISNRGRATNIKILEADPPDFTEMLRNVQRELRSRIYRPQFDETGPVVSKEMVLTHQFFYRQADLDAVQDDTTTAAESEEG